MQDCSAVRAVSSDAGETPSCPPSCAGNLGPGLCPFARSLNLSLPAGSVLSQAGLWVRDLELQEWRGRGRRGAWPPRATRDFGGTRKPRPRPDSTCRVGQCRSPEKERNSGKITQRLLQRELKQPPRTSSYQLPACKTPWVTPTGQNHHNFTKCGQSFPGHVVTPTALAWPPRLRGWALFL